jgi:large subunit ribosomal protein L24e
MKTEICSYSGYKIHPGHGKRFIRADSKQFIFITKKVESQFLDKKNPRKIAWTIVYRKMHKKGIVEETRKKRTRKQQKVTRAIVGASLEVINKKRNQKPEQRAAAREAAARAAKEKEKVKQAKKPAADKKKGAPAVPKGGKQAGPKIQKSGKGR